MKKPSKKRRVYEDADGNRYPLYEATAHLAFKSYKADKKRAVIGDPHSCFVALGLRRLPNVRDVHIGLGKDGYVVFAKGPRSKKPYAEHFTLPAKTVQAAAKLFERGGSPPTQELTLRAPTAGRTLDHRSLLNRRRSKKVRAGARTKTHRARRPSVNRLARRPRAHVTNGMVIAA